jgi:hypothetical protein
LRDGSLFRNALGCGTFTLYHAASKKLMPCLDGQLQGGGGIAAAADRGIMTGNQGALSSSASSCDAPQQLAPLMLKAAEFLLKLHRDLQDVGLHQHLPHLRDQGHDGRFLLYIVICRPSVRLFNIDTLRRSSPCSSTAADAQ